MKNLWGWWLPGVLAAMAAALALLVPSAPVRDGIWLGLGIALAQSVVSTAALKWAWARPAFDWVWLGGFLSRLVIFGITTAVVFRFTDLNLAAVLTALVISTMIFLIIETSVLKPHTGKS